MKINNFNTYPVLNRLYSLLFISFMTLSILTFGCGLCGVSNHVYYSLQRTFCFHLKRILALKCLWSWHENINKYEVVISGWRWCILSLVIRCERWNIQHDTSVEQRKIWVPDRSRTHDLPNTGRAYHYSWWPSSMQDTCDIWTRQITSSKIEFFRICDWQNFKVLGRRLYSPSLKDVAFL